MLCISCVNLTILSLSDILNICSVKTINGHMCSKKGKTTSSSEKGGPKNIYCETRDEHKHRALT